MFISLTDNGGRRISGDRRQISLKGSWVEKRSGKNRRVVTIDRRDRKKVFGNRYERRAMPMIMETQKKE